MIVFTQTFFCDYCRLLQIIVVSMETIYAATLFCQFHKPVMYMNTAISLAIQKLLTFGQICCSYLKISRGHFL